MKTGEERHGSCAWLLSAAETKAQPKRKERRYNFTIGFACGLGIGILVVLLLFAARPTPLVKNGKPSAPPAQSALTAKLRGKTTGKIKGEISPATAPKSPNQTAAVTTAAASCGVTESDRFDCWPEFWSASQGTCKQRGCCWNPSLDVGVPFCFYPDNYVGYAAVSSSSNVGMTAILERKAASPYPNDVLELQFDVIYETETTVRFRVRNVW